LDRTADEGIPKQILQNKQTTQNQGKCLGKDGMNVREAEIGFISYESKKKLCCDLFLFFTEGLAGCLVGYLTMLSVSCR
jgi:hypothetical protein